MFFRDDDSMPIRKASLKDRIIKFLDDQGAILRWTEDIKSQVKLIKRSEDILFPTYDIKVYVNERDFRINEWMWNHKAWQLYAPNLTHVLGLHFINLENPDKEALHKYIYIYMNDNIIIGMNDRETETLNKGDTPVIKHDFRNLSSKHKLVQGKPLEFALKYIKQNNLMVARQFY